MIKGRTNSGENAYIKVPTQRGQNISISLASGVNEPIHLWVNQGSINMSIQQAEFSPILYLNLEVYSKVGIEITFPVFNNFRTRVDFLNN